jgi:hypothetical protein
VARIGTTIAVGALAACLFETMVYNRWRGRGGDMRYMPEAVVFDTHDLILRSFWEQHYSNLGGFLAEASAQDASRGGRSR